MWTVERIVGAVTSFLFLAGGVLYFAFNATVYGYADGMMRQQLAWENPHDPLRKSGVVILENREAGSRRFKDGYAQLAAFDDIKADRSVSFSAYVAPKDLLRAGEASPAPAMLKVFAQARAVLYAQAECDALRQVFAKDCVVGYASGDVDHGFVRISASLQFVQKEPFGALEKGGTYTFTTASDDFRPGVGAGVGAAAAARDRLRLYRLVAARCAALKKSEGNCAITGVVIGGRFDGERGAVAPSASARFAMLARRL